LRSKKTGDIIIGIDPAKDKHQAAVVDAHGNQRGSSFSFPVSSVGYSDVLWRNVAKILSNGNSQNVVLAVEKSKFGLNRNDHRETRASSSNLRCEAL
jgi:hypothetical protein